MASKDCKGVIRGANRAGRHRRCKGECSVERSRNPPTAAPIGRAASWPRNWALANPPCSSSQAAAASVGELHGPSNDPEFESKAADIIGLYLDPPQHAAVFSVDEKTAIQALDRLDPVLPLSPGRPNTTDLSIIATARCRCTRH